MCQFLMAFELDGWMASGQGSTARDFQEVFCSLKTFPKKMTLKKETTSSHINMEIATRQQFEPFFEKKLTYGVEHPSETLNMSKILFDLLTMTKD
ncbi:unnamed protein product [Caenorhabditis sp. 36 PRJEB53466]|nr:unnamed protein product [Caenorhabditis sp. 36 PRJEB53466]